MSYRLQYIGETQIMKAATLDPRDIDNWVDIELEQNKQYLVELQQDGPVQIFNGQLIVDPNTTIWIIFPDKYGRIPYSPEAILHQWRII